MKNLITLLLLLSSIMLPQNKVFVATIDGEIDLALAPYLTRVIDEAQKEGGSAIILKINTFGGRVDAATNIKDAIFASKIPIVAFVNNRAISAGALISLSCNKIIMAPGSSIGAATVVDNTGQKQSEKYQAYMRAEMRSTAERRGRDPLIAQGMVDETIVEPNYNPNGNKLISLTYHEAVKSGMADTILNNINEVVSYMNIKDPQIKYSESNWAEGLVKFLNHPIISTLLLIIGFVGIMAEIKAPGHAAGAIAAVVALALFFGSSYILQLASALNIILFLVGIVLIALEIFVIPGFGVAGVLGILLVVGSIFYSLIGPNWEAKNVTTAIYQLAISLIASIGLILLLIKYLPKNKNFSKLILQDSIGKGVEFAVFPGKDELINQEGEAVSDLRPAGIANINNKRIDVVTEGNYVDRGAKIKVIRVEGVKVIVSKIS